MKPVYQTNFTELGDCLRACIASLLEVSFENVPDFWDESDNDPEIMRANCCKFLEDNYGLSLLNVRLVKMPMKIMSPLRGPAHSYFIIGGHSNLNEDGFHAMIAQFDETGFQYGVAHDPNPNNIGIKGDPLFAYFLVPVRINSPIVFPNQRYAVLYDGHDGKLNFGLFDSRSDIVLRENPRLTLIFENIDKVYEWFMVNTAMVSKVYSAMKSKNANKN